MRKIRFKLLSRCDNKLAVVKLIKDCTGLGLKDSKDIADLMFNNIGLVREIELREPYLDKNGEIIRPFELFSTKIKEFGDFYVTGGLSWERNFKMLSLGVGELEDYVNFVSEFMTLNNTEENKEILEVLFTKLEKNDLVELVNKIKI
jgi:hypothetical protein